MFIVQIDTDGYDYPDVYGPFDTEEQALAFEADYRERYPEMNDDDSLTFTAVRVLKLGSRETTANHEDEQHEPDPRDTKLDEAIRDREGTIHTRTTEVIRHSRANESNKPVTSVRFVVEFVMNEELPDADATPEQHTQRFADALQAAFDGDTAQLVSVRYDACLFDVLLREVLDIAPAGDPEED